jgi:hypothetical protein
MYGSMELEDLDPEEVQKERAERYGHYKKKRLRGASDGGANRFAATFKEIVKESCQGKEGLAHLKRELMVEHPALWAFGTFFNDQLPIAGLKIALQVVEVRMDEIRKAVTGDVHEMAFFLCFLISRKYAQAKNYFAAVPWAELSLFYTKQSAKEVSEHLSIAHQFAAQAQRDADFFSKSMENFDASLVVMPENEKARQERQSLLRQMEQWTGSSGKLTPGC